MTGMIKTNGERLDNAGGFSIDCESPLSPAPLMENV